jgi:hypothetical protein
MGGSASFSRVGTSDGIDSKSAPLGGHVGEVEVVPFGELLPLRAGQDLTDIAVELGHSQVAEFDRQEIAMHAQHGRHADGEVHVGAALLRAKLKERVDTRQGDTPKGLYRNAV